MMDWERLAAGAGRAKPGECESLILTLAALSEIAAHHGDSVLERIHMGYFDEADIKVEEIPVADRENICLELIRNDFFGDLIFVFVTMDDYEYACQLIESHIYNSLCSEQEYRNRMLMYVGIRMVRKKKLPWEIEYCLRSLIHDPVSLVQLIERYRRKEETYQDCVDRYRSHWQDRGGSPLISE